MSKFKIVALDLNTRQRELVDETNDMKEAEFMRAEYQLAFGNGWAIEIITTTSEV